MTNLKNGYTEQELEQQAKDTDMQMGVAGRYAKGFSEFMAKVSKEQERKDAATQIQVEGEEGWHDILDRGDEHEEYLVEIGGVEEWVCWTDVTDWQ